MFAHSRGGPTLGGLFPYRTAGRIIPLPAAHDTALAYSILGMGKDDCPFPVPCEPQSLFPYRT